MQVVLVIWSLERDVCDGFDENLSALSCQKLWKEGLVEK